MHKTLHSSTDKAHLLNFLVQQSCRPCGTTYIWRRKNRMDGKLRTTCIRRREDCWRLHMFAGGWGEATLFKIQIILFLVEINHQYHEVSFPITNMFNIRPIHCNFNLIWWKIKFMIQISNTKSRQDRDFVGKLSDNIGVTRQFCDYLLVLPTKSL